jgi:phosphoglucosamine mutase
MSSRSPLPLRARPFGYNSRYMSETKGTRKLFGTDGIRGRANRHPMTVEVALQLGRALAERLRRPGHRTRIVIGKDTRLSGYMLESALEAGIVAGGADVMLVGPLPTPGIAFITSSMRADAGIVISASHNPFYDNGIKIFAGDGFKLLDEVEADIEQRMAAVGGDGSTDDVGKAFRIDDAEGRYIQFLKANFPRARALDGLKIVVDCNNGASYQVAPQMFRELGAEVVPINVEPNGRNINEGYESLHPRAAASTVLRVAAQVGVQFDGDADRCIMVDERGQTVDGDAIMAIVASRLLAADRLPGKTVVATAMSNLGLERALAKQGGRLLRVQVGDRYVVEAMREHGYTIGGEQSGHLIFLDRHTTGDGILAALVVLGLMVEEGKPLSEMASVMTRFPQVLLNFDVPRKVPLDELPAVTKVIAGVESSLGAEGRVNVRYSGTEPKARVMIEGPDEKTIRAHAEEIVNALKQALAAY